MASPPPTHGHGPIPDDTQAFDVGDFYTSPPLDDQGTKDFMTCMMEVAQFGPWSDLPPELLGLVLKRLPSLADRVRLRAVCHPWRSNSILHTLTLPFPWLTLPDGTFLSISGNEVHRMPLPHGTRWHGSIDKKLLLLSSDGLCSLLDPSSKTTLELPNLVTIWQSEIDDRTERTHVPVSYKLVEPSHMDSSQKFVVAAPIPDKGYSPNLSIIQPPAASYTFKGVRDWDRHILLDFAFFHGRFYVVSEFYKLFTIDFGENLCGGPNIKCVIDTIGDYLRSPLYFCQKNVCGLLLYLVECGNKLLMVQRFTHCSQSSQGFSNDHTGGFMVLEADLRTNPARWRMVSDLGGHALFLGRQSSKAVPAGECSGSQEDCIYFICDYPCPKYSTNPLHDAVIYNMRNGMIMPLHSGSAAVPQRQAGQWGLTWFFPPKVA
ncbi:hypothetical protein CFC21_091451 [Triticum aestivum]|uniref:DUF295 domain-containing protein n=2 Tax=Triticum aestivum TaxID=4565 RepID=A0A3B6QAE7_WHEAT|nr:uncharacterized protein LOC123141055 [Triticum aestivum]KAF7088330.1 hypothetical protein CFC21_091451 [Triticum aestivum]